jgi:hypothetical protein
LIDLTDAFDGLDAASLAVDRDDFHPNAAGHALLAARIDQALKSVPELSANWDRNAGRGAARLARAREKSAGLTDPKVKAASFAVTPGARGK